MTTYLQIYVGTTIRNKNAHKTNTINKINYTTSHTIKTIMMIIRIYLQNHNNKQHNTQLVQTNQKPNTHQTNTKNIRTNTQQKQKQNNTKTQRNKTNSIHKWTTRPPYI